MEIANLSFKEALKKIHSILGLKFTITFNREKKQHNPLKIFEDIRSRNKNDNYDLKFYDDDVLNSHHFIKLPHINLIKEGIIPSVQKEFNVMYDYKRNRILFPHRHWCTGKILGVFGRTTNDHWDMLGIPKYYGILPYPKSLNLYGLYENYKTIQERGFVCVVEGEKSTMKLKSYGYPVGVSLGGHELSDEQIRILIGLDVDIVFALDKDIPEQISKDMCKQFKGIRSAYYIYDKYDLLGEKDAPIDKGYKIFEYLLKNKRKVV